MQTFFFWIRATDVNPAACTCTRKTLAQNGIRLCDVTTADLVRELSLKLHIILAYIFVFRFLQ